MITKRRTVLKIAGLVMLAVFMTGGRIVAQDASRYVISAKAGGINYVSGDANIKRAARSDASPASVKDSIESGDELRTGSQGRAEVLLNPGSYLRVEENSTVRLTDASIESLRVDVLAGRAIFEVAGKGDDFAPVAINAAGTNFTLREPGIYSFQTQPNGTGLLRVYKGKINVRGNDVKDGREIIVGPATTTAASKFDKDNTDEFASWSLLRAEGVAAANRKLSDSSLSSLYSSYGSRSNGFRRGGYWLWDPFYSSRTFLPFNSGWSSPYGFGYHRHLRSIRYGGFGVFSNPRPRINIVHRVHRPVIIRHGGGRKH